ncbi:MAG: rRNA maturation RNase YbeY [Planctomycetes bacterium]|mgnify:CR=1 FL=1|nr:rRNA maturation RNase YbeY [Planctomycetota bacterium]MCB9913153.1 rRNA maturation RNase YbeY [Planctomycetota bacterium]
MGACEAHWTVEPAWFAPNEVQEIVQAALDHGDRPEAELSVVFVDDPTLARMHAEFLGDPSPTDVISFDLGDEGPGPVGELYVSVDCARRVAAERGVPVERELALYLVHGTLHLCGWDDHDPEDRAEMRQAEALVLGRLGFGPDPLPHD